MVPGPVTGSSGWPQGPGDSHCQSSFLRRKCWNTGDGWGCEREGRLECLGERRVGWSLALEQGSVGNSVTGLLGGIGKEEGVLG